jgi:hypothetical protein
VPTDIEQFAPPELSACNYVKSDLDNDVGALTVGPRLVNTLNLHHKFQAIGVEPYPSGATKHAHFFLSG